MPDGADMRDRTPSGSRYLMIAALVVWAVVVVPALVVAAAGAAESLVWPLIFVTLTLVIVGAAALSRRFRVTEQVTVLAFVALALIVALAALASSHRATRVDAVDPTLVTTGEEARGMCTDYGVRGLAVILGTEATAEAILDAPAAMQPEERKDAVRNGCREGLAS